MKVKSAVNKFLSNKWVLNIVSIVALLNVLGYMIMGNFNNVLFFIISAILVRYFSKNMILVLGVPLLMINLISFKNGSTIEGMEANTNEDGDDENDDEKKKDKKEDVKAVVKADVKTNVESANKKADENFEVGRAKNGGSKIDYAATIEGAYDQLNSILGSDGIKNLTGDTQRLMEQQAGLAKSMESMAPMIDKMMPMAQKAQELLNGMGGADGQGLGGLMNLAKNMTGGSSTEKKV